MNTVTQLPPLTFPSVPSIVMLTVVILVIASTVVGIVLSRPGRPLRRFAEGEHTGVQSVTLAVTTALLVVGVGAAGSLGAERADLNVAYIKHEYGITVAAGDAQPGSEPELITARDSHGVKRHYVLMSKNGGIAAYTADMRSIPSLTH